MQPKSVLWITHTIIMIRPSLSVVADTQNSMQMYCIGEHTVPQILVVPIQKIKLAVSIFSVHAPMFYHVLAHLLKNIFKKYLYCYSLLTSTHCIWKYFYQLVTKTKYVHYVFIPFDLNLTESLLPFWIEATFIRLFSGATALNAHHSQNRRSG